MITSMVKDSEDGDQLWRQVTRDIKKLGGKPKAGASAAPKRVRLKDRGVVPVSLPDVKIPQGGGIDRKTQDKVRKGEIKIDAKLDLHGMNVDQARSALLQFMAQSYAASKRCVLVITGKGSPGKGVIRREFPLWLEDSAIRACILSSAVAQPKDGGSGAYYIYLRKNKTFN